MIDLLFYIYFRFNHIFISIYDKSLALDERWPEDMFIIWGNSPLKKMFFGIVLGLTINFNMVSEPSPKSIAQLDIIFQFSGYPSLISAHQTQ